MNPTEDEFRTVHMLPDIAQQLQRSINEQRDLSKSIVPFFMASFFLNNAIIYLHNQVLPCLLIRPHNEAPHHYGRGQNGHLFLPALKDNRFFLGGGGQSRLRSNVQASRVGSFQPVRSLSKSFIVLAKKFEQSSRMKPTQRNLAKLAESGLVEQIVELQDEDRCQCYTL